MSLHADPLCLILDRWAGDRRALRGLLLAQGWHLAGETARWRDARRLLQDVRYSLVFLSEKLIGGDAWSLLPYLHHGTRVVVTTRDPEDPLRAFEVNALDYLVKPFSAARLARTLARLEDAPRRGSSLRPPAPSRRRITTEPKKLYGSQVSLDVPVAHALLRSNEGASALLRLNS